MSVHTAAKNPAVLSYHTLRRLVGLIALALPFALPGGAVLLALLGPGHKLPHPLLERSISDYYWTPMGACFVGSLCVIAAFLICSRGYDLIDEITGYLAGIFTLGVAFFPSENPAATQYTRLEIDIGFAHTAFAALMFLAIAYFCLFLFRRTAPHGRVTRRKRHRNTIYGICGLVIVVCIFAITSLTVKAMADGLTPGYPLFCFESLALIAFGIAWLTKGEGFLRDKPHEHIRISQS